MSGKPEGEFGIGGEFVLFLDTCARVVYNESRVRAWRAKEDV